MRLRLIIHSWAVTMLKRFVQDLYEIFSVLYAEHHTAEDGATKLGVRNVRNGIGDTVAHLAIIWFVATAIQRIR
jgi:hypothetical protein